MLSVASSDLVAKPFGKSVAEGGSTGCRPATLLDCRLEGVAAGVATVAGGVIGMVLLVGKLITIVIKMRRAPTQVNIGKNCKLWATEENSKPGPNKSIRYFQ